MVMVLIGVLRYFVSRATTTIRRFAGEFKFRRRRLKIVSALSPTTTSNNSLLSRRGSGLEKEQLVYALWFDGLRQDALKGITFKEAYPWDQVHGVALDKPLHSAVLSCLRYSAMNKQEKMDLRGTLSLCVAGFFPVMVIPFCCSKWLNFVHATNFRRSEFYVSFNAVCAIFLPFSPHSFSLTLCTMYIYIYIYILHVYICFWVFWLIVYSFFDLFVINQMVGSEETSPERIVDQVVGEVIH